MMHSSRNVDALHADCLACRAGTEGLSPQEEALAILLMHETHGLTRAVADLYFVHRRLFDESLKSMYAELTRS